MLRGGIFMKRVLICMISVLFILLLGSCSKEELFITADNITFNTILVKRNGSLYAAIVEDFDKSYYNLGELNEFVAQEVNEYNKKAGGKEVTIEELKLVNGKVVLILGYSKMAHYSAFNDVPAAYFNAAAENVALELPSQYVDAKKDTVVDREKAFKNKKNQVLVLYEPYEIIVEGDIKFYSQNAELLDKNRVKSTGDDMTVVIYRQ